MRVLALETSTHRGSVALIEGGRCIAASHHDQPSAHAELLLPLVDQTLTQAGWDRKSLDRIAVGVGPGSFTGLRVGIALAQGIALGLAIPIVGVSSLGAMAKAAGAAAPAFRATLLDARRGEIFLAWFDADGRELVPPRAVPRDQLVEELRSLYLSIAAGSQNPDAEAVLLGEVVREIQELQVWKQLRSEETDRPHATWVGILGEQRELDGRPVEPAYARDPDAVKPNLPADPLAQEPRQPLAEAPKS